MAVVMALDAVHGGQQRAAADQQREVAGAEQVMRRRRRGGRDGGREVLTVRRRRPTCSWWPCRRRIPSPARAPERSPGPPARTTARRPCSRRAPAAAAAAAAPATSPTTANRATMATIASGDRDRDLDLASHELPPPWPRPRGRMGRSLAVRRRGREKGSTRYSSSEELLGRGEAPAQGVLGDRRAARGTAAGSPGRRPWSRSPLILKPPNAWRSTSAPVMPRLM